MEKKYPEVKNLLAGLENETAAENELARIIASSPDVAEAQVMVAAETRRRIGMPNIAT